MTDAGKFLSRWSQRKRAVQEEGNPPDDKAPVQEAKAPSDVRAHNPAPGTRTEPPKPTPPVDISRLPPIESITATTDIKEFLAPGVPPELTRAALRRAWVVDPKIKNFIEMAENQWDFTSPDTPGFGTLSGVDVRRLLAEVMGDDREAQPHEPGSLEEAGQQPADASAGNDSPEVAAKSSEPEAAPQEHAEVAAMQHKPSTPETPKKLVSKRRHGGALPE